MEKAKISPGQLAALIFLFEMGTALVVSLGLKAEKDAWLAILLGLAGGMGLFGVYVSLYRQFPDHPLTSYVRIILGRWIGWPLGLLYVLFFIYGAARDLRDGADLLISSVLDQTPMIAVSSIMILTTGYVLHKGIEVLARTAQIYFAVLIILGVLSNFLLAVSGVIDIDRLLPVLEKGWSPVIRTTLTQSFEFPFAEMICFTMLLPYLNRPAKGIKLGMMTLLAGGLVLSFSSAMDIAVLGVDIAGRATFPLLMAVSLVNIKEFIQRMDVLVVMTLIIGDFFKVAVFYYAAVQGATDIFRIRDHRRLVYPIGLIILFISAIIAANFSEHIEEGNFALMTVFLLFGVVIPIVLWGAAWIRKALRQSP
ncbi:GerAB/ArcD/ProY family transporter [Cohnella sp. CFH 77786]|uniref:GerAB/ArcD/ProY family transporter n=1 Tax=Cohnella sp. CFH 77786 TaxID=2662265 RepID=UPI001C60E6EE|nr:GerAB/ArcD/ProY family transporter [Cohnella sp. CFH 77786]MBW5445135.1 GerAB/ArcD/ProY family transporter [Cohnella sp. CFH 77786]